MNFLTILFCISPNTELRSQDQCALGPSKSIVDIATLSHAWACSHFFIKKPKEDFRTPFVGWQSLGSVYRLRYINVVWIYFLIEYGTQANRALYQPFGLGVRIIFHHIALSRTIAFFPLSAFIYFSVWASSCCCWHLQLNQLLILSAVIGLCYPVT